MPAVFRTLMPCIKNSSLTSRRWTNQRSSSCLVITILSSVPSSIMMPNHLDEVNKYKTPFVIWANYEIETQTDMTVSSSALGAYTLLNAGIDLPNYFKYNYYASRS